MSLFDDAAKAVQGAIPDDLASKVQGLADDAQQKVSDVVPDNIENTVKDMAGKAGGVMDGGLTGAADKLKEFTPEAVDGMIDKATGFFDKK